MKPKTRLQVEVWDLHKRLPNPKEQEPFVISNHAAYYTTHYKNLVCLECNHQWKPAQTWQEEVIGVECPSCKNKLLKVHTQNGGIATRILTYSVVHVVDRFQVFRYFSCTKTLRKNKLPEYSFKSLFEEWIDYEKDKSVIVGRTQSWSGDGFSWSDYEVRYKSQSGWRGNPYDGFASDINCPGAQFLPRFEKYGVANKSHNCDHRFLLRKIESSPKIETLLKANQNELLAHAVHKDSNYNRFWSQIKIVLRNNYKIDDAGIWYDYLELLQYFKKDILSPKYILPKDLKIAHNQYVSKKAKIIAIENAKKEVLRQERERKKAAEDELLKNIKSEIFKDFILSKGKMKIVALIEENDVLEEGKILKHCVHTNGYHKKSGILLMSARVNGKRKETIELSLSTFKIIQSRGFDNNPTSYHNEIINLVQNNINKIVKLVEKFKTAQNLNINKAQNEIAA